MGLYSDLSFDQGQYIPQYAGAPLAEIEKTADALADRHYQNIANANELQLVANQLKSKMLPGAKSYVDSHISSIDQALQDMAQQGGENSTARVQALARQLKGDQGILNALQRSDEYNKQTAAIDKLKLDGEVPLFDEARRNKLAQAAATDELYGSPYEMKVEPFRTPVPEMEAVWKTINPDSYESAIKAAAGTTPKELLGKAIAGTDPDLALFFETITRSGIGGDKIKGMLDNAWSTYKNTPSYKQQTGNLIGKSEGELKKEFYKQGLLRVFQNVSRDYKPTPSAVLNDNSGTTPADNSLIVPMEATVRDTFEKTKSKIPGAVDHALLSSERKVLEERWNSMSMTGNFLALDDKAKKEKAEIETRLGEINAEMNKTQEDRDKEELDTFKTAVEVAGIQPANNRISLGTGKKQPAKSTDNMSDGEWKAFMKTPEGQKALQGYKDNYQALRYNTAFANIPLSKDASETNERFIQKTIQSRPIMNIDGSKVYTNILDENQQPQDDEMGILNQAIAEGKFQYVGTATPRNLFAKMGNDEKFVKPIRIRVQDPNDKTITRDYYLGQPMGHTSGIDINENILWETATAKPGQFNSVGNGYEIQMMPSDIQRAKNYPRYGASVMVNGKAESVPQDKFVNNQDQVLLKDAQGEVLPFANYSAAAKYLAQQGIQLQLK